MTDLFLMRRSAPILLVFRMTQGAKRLVQGRLAGMLLLILASLATSPTWAEPVDPYSVRGVTVDISAPNAGMARDQALAQGQRQALDVVLRRMTVASDWPRLPKLTDAQLSTLVLDIGIDQEKHSAVRYLASLSVRFKADGLRALLRGAGLPYADWRGRPVAVLPLLRTPEGGDPFPWDSANPWSDAWKSPAAQALVPLIVPSGSAPSPEPALASAALTSATSEQLASLAQRFGTGDLVVAVAQPVKLPNNSTRLDVTISATGPLASSLVGPRSLTAEPNETLEALTRRMVAQLAHQIEETYKTPGNLLQFDHNDTVRVLAALPGGLSDWLNLRDKLTRIGAIRSYEITALSRGEASLLLHFLGDATQLQAALAQTGWSLTWAEDHWILQHGPTAPVLSPPSALGSTPHR